MTDALALLVDVSMKLAALGLLVWLATRRAGLAQARLAHAVWLGVLAAALVVPVVTWWAAPSTSLVPSETVRRAIAAASPQAPALTIWLLRGYAVIATARLLRLAAAAWRIRRLRREAHPVVAGTADEAALVHACTAHAAVLLETAAVGVPATAGWWRPCVLLPAGWRALDPGVLAAIVRHELAHVRRRAYATIVGAEIVKALFWFHPVAWLACARLRWFEELACDRAAAGDDPLRYARALLAVAHLQSRRTPSLALSSGSQLARRVDCLVDPPRPTPWWAAAALTVALALLPSLPFVRVRLSAVPPSVQISDHAAVHALRHGH